MPTDFKNLYPNQTVNKEALSRFINNQKLLLTGYMLVNTISETATLLERYSAYGDSKLVCHENGKLLQS